MNVQQRRALDAARRKAHALYSSMVDSVGGIDVCFACREPKARHTDHVVPRAHGGPDAPWNWQPLCPGCNLERGDRHAGDWRPEPFRSQLRDIYMQIDADMSAETSDGRWLTYDQIAKLRNIDKPSAVKLATRNRWRRRKDNAGQMQVCVPLHWFDRAQDRADRYVDKSADMSRAINVLEAAIAALRERAEAAEKGRDGERQRADALRDRVEALQAQLAGQTAALQRLQALEAAEAARKAQGLLARLRAAVRGR